MNKNRKHQKIKVILILLEALCISQTSKYASLNDNV